MVIWLTFSLALVASSLTLTWLAIRELTRSRAAEAERTAALVEKVVEFGESQAKLLDKALALLAAKGPLEFQAVQAMSMSYTEEPRYDPSDEAEIERLGAERGDHGDDQLGPEDEIDFLRALGVPGSDAQ